MLVGHAKTIAREWVREAASALPGFGGAFYHGSTNWLADDATLPVSSDLDIMVVLDDPDPPQKPGKFVYRGVLLEVSYLAGDQLTSPDLVLGRSDLAGSFRTPGVILDPTGHLTALQVAVARDYAQRRWVRARCEHVTGKIDGFLRGVQAAPSPYDRATAWLFAAGGTTLLPLVAGLRNPTVRKRYLAARELLVDYGHQDFYEPLLDLLGCAAMTQEQVAGHLDALAAVFDATGPLIRTPVFFAADLTPAGRAVAIDGSRELIARGDHREAIFWIVATYSRCLQVLEREAAADVQARYRPGFRQLLADLGIASDADLPWRGEQVRAFLPAAWAVAEAVMAANPDIEA